MKRKIIFFLPDLHGGGAERVAVNMLRQLDMKKFDITLVCVNKVGIFIKLVPDSVQIIDLKSSRTIFSVLKLRKVILELKPDVIFSTLLHTHVAVDLSMIGLQQKAMTIFRSPISPKLLLKNNQISSLMRKLVERAYRNADKVLAQTPEMKTEINTYHGTDIAKIDVIFNPIDIQFIESKLKNIDNPFDKKHTNVVAAGRLTEQKGFDVLIKSFKRVVEEDDSYRLYIIGEDIDGEKDKLLKIISELELETYITLLGFQDNPYKFFYYSDLYVLSSRWEGLPNTVLENLYLKKPVVSTKCIPFMNVLIEDKKNGLLVDVDDISSLSRAIINYKDIDTSYTTVEFNNDKLDEIFIDSRV